MPRRALLFVVIGGGCFSGDATLGGVCVQDADCGPGQACEHEICGRCGDGVGQRGELCFGEATAVEGLPGADHVQPVDLDADGDDDLLTWTASTGSIHTTIAEGADLASAGDLELGAPVLGVDAADLDGDGFVDVVALTATDLVVAWGDGTGALAIGTTVAAPLEGRGLAAVAAVEDRPGFVVATSDAPDLSWWPVDAARTIAAPGRVAVSGAAPVLGRAAVFDRDVAPDLVVGSADGEVTVWHGASDGFVAGPSVSTAAAVRGLAVLDVDGDGRFDAIALGEDGSATWLLGNGAGSLSLAAELDLPAPGSGVAAIDLTRDTRREIVVATPGEASLSVFVARGREYPDRTGLSLPAAASDVWITDLDGDQRLDVVVATSDGLLRREVDP